jgi:3-dehydroquinate synthase
LVLPPGEATKSAAHLAAVYDWALGLGIDRRTPVLALGGGVVGDLAGFAAATLLRGLPLVQLPTSLIAQVDSAIGGKTGINHAAGKNLIGAFHQPRLVLADPATLRTLPQREWTGGLAEVVKAALIADAAFFDWLESNWSGIVAREPEVVAPLVRRAAAIKAAIVAEDEREAGRRALLNFGHTFGHAIERAAGYGTFTHGEAVALGMRAALHLSHALRPDVSFRRADALVARIPVPDGLADLRTADLMQATRTDKKRRGDRIRYVVLREPGAAHVTADVPPGAVEAAWAYAKNGQDSSESPHLPR